MPKHITPIDATISNQPIIWRIWFILIHTYKRQSGTWHEVTHRLWRCYYVFYTLYATIRNMGGVKLNICWLHVSIVQFLLHIILRGHRQTLLAHHWLRKSVVVLLLNHSYSLGFVMPIWHLKKNIIRWFYGIYGFLCDANMAPLSFLTLRHFASKRTESAP